ncbi:hypothetical protein BDV98DRAFT_591856 [Pterulicium gracile]|uniref:Uncharacterized protein n=1 Tax=Pterulicium gracile TaxID=1884261 RepID=A0A5C3QRB0_9AGAR|nr:hypothetical protein BDV98DRAFT_591856 [Pterula gracilis]
MVDYYEYNTSRGNSRGQVEHHADLWTRPKQKNKPHRATALLSHASPNPPLTLNPEEELAAVSSHLAALAQNVIPPHVDPSRMIDPQLVLDFDVAAGKRSEEELKVLVQQTWEHNPVVVYCKHYSPQSRSLRNILSKLDIQPPPTIFEVDVRPDSEVLMPLIARVINAVFAVQSSSDHDSDGTEDGASSPPASSLNPFPLPALLIGGKVISGGDVELVDRLLENGKLKEMMREAGAEVKDAKKKKKGRR